MSSPKKKKRAGSSGDIIHQWTEPPKKRDGHMAICFALCTVAYCDVVRCIFWGQF